MKKIIMLTMMATLLIYGCQQENEEVYSCDKRLNEWAHRNLDAIRSMDREAWLQLDEDYKRPAFNALTPEQKLLFWKDKLKEVMASFNWSDGEMKHLIKLYQYLEEHPDLYTEESLNDSIQNETFANFVRQWKDDAIVNLNWTEEQIYGMACTGNRMINKEGTYAVIHKKRSQTKVEYINTPDCNCQTKYDPNCTKGNCKEVWGGIIIREEKYDGYKKN